MLVYLTNKRNRILKIWRGLRLTQSGHWQAASGDWWDRDFYETDRLADRHTIDRMMNPFSAAYHYASVELIISKYLHDVGFERFDQPVVDVGAGSGHWVQFYDELGFDKIVGIDVSEKSVASLRTRFPDREFHLGTARDALSDGDLRPGLVNAIGVMFHIVDDVEWRATLKVIAAGLQPGGLLIVGGHFGLVDGVNVQFCADGSVNKRLRSKANWTRTLRDLGFRRVDVVRNRLAFAIDATLPENHLLFATR